MAEKFDKKQYYDNIARLFKNGPKIRHRIASKIQAPGESGTPIGTAKAFLKNTSSLFSSQIAAYGTFNRNSRYSDYQEMESHAVIASALDIISDECTVKDEYGEVIRIYSSNRDIKRTLERLFYDVLNIEFNSWSWIRNLCKYGDQFLLLDHHPDYGVLNALPLPVNEVEREEAYDPEDPFSYRFRWVTQGNKVIDNWQVVHFRMIAGDQFLPYGMSYLEPARRTWRQLIMMEDAIMVYRIVRSPERRVFYVDVGNIPPKDVPQYMETVKTQTKRSQVVDSNSGRVDLRYHAITAEDDYYLPKRGDGANSTRIENLPGGQFTGDIEDLEYFKCFRGITGIKLLDGTSDTIKNIVKRINNKESLWTYSINPETLEVQPSKIIAGQNVGKRNNFVRVNLDNGKYIETTKDHLFILSDGRYIQAQHLKQGDSLAALYTKTSSKLNKNYLDGYEMVYNNGKDRWEYTHRLVAKECLKDDLLKINVVHHSTFNKLNNNPECLEVLENGKAHRDLHARLNKENKEYVGEKNPNYNREADVETLLGAAKLCNSFSELKSKTGYNDYILQRLIQSLGLDYYKFHKQYMIFNPAVYYHLGCNKTIDEVKEVIRWPHIKTEDKVCKSLNLSHQTIEKIAISNGYSSFKSMFNDIKGFTYENVLTLSKECTSAKEISRKLNCSETRIKNIVLNNGFKTFREFRKNTNMPMYRTEQMFKKGVVPHNKKLNHKIVSVEELNIEEDAYDIQVEKNNNFAVDVGIFVHNSKLLAALKIPKSYIGYDEGIGSKSQLSMEDVRFARTIQRIQRIFLAEMNKIAMLHLFSKGYEGEDLVNFEIQMANPSSIYEMQQLEVWRARFEVAQAAQEGLLDKKFVYKHIFRISDEDITDIEEGRKEDRALDAEIEAIQAPAPEEEAPPPGGEEAAPEGAPEAPPTEPEEPEGMGAGEQTTEPLDMNAGETPVTDARDPNIQRAMPNELKGGTGRKEKISAFADLHKHAFNQKKTNNDNRKVMNQMFGAARNAFGEGEEVDLEDAVEENFQKNKLELEKISRSLEKVEGLRKTGKNKKIL